MKFSALFLLLLGLFGGSIISGQTKKEFKSIFKIDSQNTYQNVLMRPTFSNDGQICRLRLEPYSPKKDQDSVEYKRISGGMIEEILDMISPANQRGKRTDNWGIGEFLGQVYLTPYEFENLSVTTSGHIWPKSGRLNANKWRVLEADEKSIFPPAELVTFEWKNRRCG